MLFQKEDTISLSYYLAQTHQHKLHPVTLLTQCSGIARQYWWFLGKALCY